MFVYVGTSDLAASPSFKDMVGRDYWVYIKKRTLGVLGRGSGRVTRMDLLSMYDRML